MLQSILTGPVIANSMALPTHLATTLLQQHVNNVLSAQSISSNSVFVICFIIFINYIILNSLDVQTVQPEFVPDGRTVQQQQQLQQNNQTFITGNGTSGVKRTIAQIDGANDSSTSDEDDDDDDEDIDDEIGDNDDDDEDDDLDQNSASDAVSILV